MSSFDQNPEKGGTPEMASQATMKQPAVIGHDLAQRAHAADVLLVVHAVDDRAGPEEQAGP